MSFDPLEQFPNFYENQVARALASAHRWTVSGNLGTDGAKGKAPIDMRHLLETGCVRGAWATDDRCLVGLAELSSRLPEAANAAFYLQSSTDGLVVIDIEPGCPEGVAQNLLALPGAVYTETSLSGKGYHLVTPLPKNIADFDDAKGKKVLREEHGWYEILLEHWVTFTRCPIDQDVMLEAGSVDLTQSEFTSFEDLYASLAKVAKPTRSVSTEDVVEKLPRIPGSKQIVEKTCTGATDRLKTPDSFNNDLSRYEFSVLSTMYREMRRHLVTASFINRTTYSGSDRAWLLYLAAKEVLPTRDKHYEQRNGRPYLLDRAAAMVSLSSAPTN